MAQTNTMTHTNTQTQFSKETATIILEQLGGRKFIAMTGSYNLSTTAQNGLCMHLRANKARAKYLSITLKGDDTYTMVFKSAMNSKTLECKVIREIDGVYFDMLQDIFTEVTGMYTSL